MLSYRSLFFFNDTATTEIYTLSLHDALPISEAAAHGGFRREGREPLVAEPRQRLVDVREPPDAVAVGGGVGVGDRKSTRLNSSHANISYAVFCLKKKKDQTERYYTPPRLLGD